MAKAKSELLKEAKKLKLDVSEKNTIAQIQAAIKSGAKSKKPAETEKVEIKKEKPIAKAGKRSAKAIAETDEKQAKEERKKATEEDESVTKPKVPIKPARSRLEKRSKKYREAAKLIDRSKNYTLAEALELAIKTSLVKFDAAVEIHVRLDIDPKQADQNIRDNIILPAGTGKTVRVAVFAEEEDAKKALQAGADIAGADDLLAQIDKGNINFDVLIATPNVMAKLSKYARVLGPKGLMPNPKSGTVTKDVDKAITEIKAGRLEYRVDSTGIVHVAIGKVSFGPKKLGDNTAAFFASVAQNKPSSLKGIYVKSIAVTTTMGPSIKVQTSEI